MEPGLPGEFHISKDATDDYCMQIVAEARTVTRAGKAKWVRVRRANHYLDCEMMNVACAHQMRLHKVSDATRDKYRGAPTPPVTHAARPGDNDDFIKTEGDGWL